MTKTMTHRFLLASVAGAGLLSAILPASAQVVYARPTPFDPLFSQYDESYGTSPSFQIYPRAYGEAPAVRVVEHCQYPNGWNATDFARDVNGTPAGRDHECPVSLGGRVRARY